MSGKRRPVSSPLALAVLAQLAEGPMHPYEIAATLRSRGKEHSIKLNYGSLYTVVDNLAKHGLIEAVEARREGRLRNAPCTGSPRPARLNWTTG